MVMFILYLLEFDQPPAPEVTRAERIEMKGYHLIVEEIIFGEKYQLWEHDVYGDEAPALVVYDGRVVGETYDSLSVWYEENI